jgi:large-conductance mechanosensitive channel
MPAHSCDGKDGGVRDVIDFWARLNVFGLAVAVILGVFFFVMQVIVEDSYERD